MPHSTGNRRYDVAIVGAGPVGLTLANLLGRAGVATVVLERHATTVTESRAAVLDGESLRILHRTGLGDTLSEAMITGYGHYSVDGRGRTLLHVQPERQPHAHPFMTWIHQPHLEATLRTGLARFDSVELRTSHAVSALTQTTDAAHLRGVTKHGEPFAVTANFVVGCDGAASTVRKLLDVPFTGSTYQERWLVLDWEDDRTDLPGGSWFHSDPDGPWITAKMPGNRRRWEFALRTDAPDATVLDDDHIAAVLARHTDPHLGTIVRKTVYRFHDRQAATWRSRRVLLAGDAAHLMPPFAGQGLNNGLRDAVNLAWKLAAVSRGAHQGLLDSYEDERRPLVMAATRTAVRMGTITAGRGRCGHALLDHTLRLAQHIPAWRRCVRENRFTPWPRHRPGGQNLGRCSHVGALLPQPPIHHHDPATAPGPAQLDEVLGGRFTLLGSAASLHRLDDSDLQAVHHAGIALLAWTDTAPTTRPRTVPVHYINDHGHLGAWFGKHHDHVALIRPDNFVHSCTPPTDTSAAVTALLAEIGTVPRSLEAATLDRTLQETR